MSWRSYFTWVCMLEPVPFQMETCSWCWQLFIEGQKPGVSMCCWVWLQEVGLLAVICHGLDEYSSESLPSAGGVALALEGLGGTTSNSLWPLDSAFSILALFGNGTDHPSSESSSTSNALLDAGEGKLISAMGRGGGFILNSSFFSPSHHLAIFRV